MITLERTLRRLVAIDGTIYVLELAPAAVLLRYPRKRTPVAVMSWKEILERGNKHVLAALSRLLGKRHSRDARARKRRRKLSSRANRRRRRSRRSS